MTKIMQKVHPAANLFPLMDKAELKELATNIKKNGLIADIVRDKDGVILDGRNRLEACRMAGVEPRFVQYNGNDPTSFIVAANIHRRHLTTAQKRDLAAKLLKMYPAKSDRQLAKQVKLSPPTLAKIRKREEGRENILHVEKRTDTKGRKQPATKPRLVTVSVKNVPQKFATPIVATKDVTQKVVAPISIAATADSESARALKELKYAIGQWLPKLSADDLKEVRAYFQNHADARGKTNGARANGSAEQSVEERRALNAKLAEEENAPA